jgi:hypothetical protein
MRLKKAADTLDKWVCDMSIIYKSHRDCTQKKSFQMIFVRTRRARSLAGLRCNNIASFRIKKPDF